MKMMNKKIVSDLKRYKYAKVFFVFFFTDSRIPFGRCFYHKLN